MGTIINLYVIPRMRNANGLHAAEVAEIIAGERLVAAPVVIGPAFTVHDHRLVQPQLADAPYAHSDYALRSRRYLELPKSFADFGCANEPQIAAFARLDETNPAVRDDFSHYTGLECSVAIYLFPQGFRLLLASEFRDDPLFDGTVFEWIHLQGKCAPWLDLYQGSCVDRAIRTVWPDVDVVENDWP